MINKPPEKMKDMTSMVCGQVKNRDTLLDHGMISGRQACLDIVEHALSAVDPFHATLRAVKLKGDLLMVEKRCLDLSALENIYVIGAGKATMRQAMAIEKILGHRITTGLVVVKHGQAVPLNHIQVMEAGHPVPDEHSFTAGKKMMALMEKTDEKDLVICLMSGGVSATCCAPVAGISPEDKRDINHLLVHSGAQVTEIMTVRRHLSRIKGGRLAGLIHPAACITLTVSDTIGDPLEWNADWTHPDSSTFEDAVAILHRYGVWNRAPESVRHYFESFSPEKETPKSLDQSGLWYCMTVKTRDLWVAARQKALALGFAAYILTTELKGESREAGRVLSALARESGRSGMPFTAPCVLIAAGETGVCINTPPKGNGGANQELGCGACLDLTPADRVVVCAIDTDGTDGPTDFAGALTDGFTVERAREMGLDFHGELMAHNTTELLQKTGDILTTGHTGSNVNDLVVIVVL